MNEARNKIIKSIITEVKKLAEKYGEDITRTATTRWSNAVRDRKSLEIEKKDLEEKLKIAKAKLSED